SPARPHVPDRRADSRGSSWPDLRWTSRARLSQGSRPGHPPPRRPNDAARFATRSSFSGLIRPAHDLHGALDVPPLVSLLVVAFFFAGLRVLGGLGNRSEAVPFNHLPRDRVNLHLGHHAALPMFSLPPVLQGLPPVQSSPLQTVALPPRSSRSCTN